MREVALGAILGLGLWLIVDGMPQSSLSSRIAPYLRDFSQGAARAQQAKDLFAVLAVLAPHPIRLARELWRGRRTARRRIIDCEIQALLDRATVCLSAGLSVPAMFERLGTDSGGILGGEVRIITRELSAGVSLLESCSASERRIRHEGWSRFIEHVLSARRHGTPIAEVVRSLAADERAAAGRRLLESASSREIYMLIPLVFVILPMTVLVAVFPGLVALGSLPA